MKEKPILGIILGVIGFTAFTMGDVTLKYLSARYDLYFCLVLTGLGSLFFLLLLSKPLGGLRATLHSKKRKLMIIRGFVLTAQIVSVVYAFSVLPITTVYPLVFVAPFVSAMLGIFMLGDKVGWRRWCTIAMGFVGVLIVLRPGFIPLEMGALAALLSGTLAALSWVMVKYIGEKDQTLMSYSFYPTLCLLAVTAVPGLFNAEAVTFNHTALFLFASLCGVVGMLSLSTAFQWASPTAVSPFHYTQLLFGALWGYLFFDELPDFWTYIGGGVIVLSGLYIVYREHKKKRNTANSG